MPLLPIDDPEGVLLQVPFVSEQPYAELCWAACCEMIFRSYGRNNVTLCRMASEASGLNCCPDPSSKACDQPHWPDDILRNHGFSFLRSTSALTLANILYEINCKRPVMAVLEWLGADGSDEGRHIIVVGGYYPNCDLLVNDPLKGQARLGYDYLNAAYNLGRWAESYYNLTPFNDTF
jgi:hypothetical protein